MDVEKKYPCMDLIKRIQKLNKGETIERDELDDLRMNLEIFPQCRKYLNITGLEKIEIR